MTAKQRLFLDEYLLSGSATAAYRKAFGVKDDSMAAANGSRLLKHPEIVAALEARQKAVQERNDIDVDALIAELKKLAFSNLTRIITWNEIESNLKPSDQLAETDSATISEFTETDNKYGKRRSIKLYSKPQAIETLLKLAGAFKADNQQKDQGVHITINETDLGKPQS
jgi:phage terminase small subunit